ncbi:MAG: flagellar hook-length control protein [Mycobacterium sp.]
MTAPTKRDAIEAAMNIADDVAQGRLDPAQLDAQLEAACRELVGTVAGPDDPLWPLQVQIARGVLAAGGIEAAELSEWAAVGRRRENPDAAGAVALTGVVEPAEGADVPTGAESDATVAHSAENGADDGDYAPEPAALAADVELVDPEPAADTDTGCTKCSPAPVTRGPKFNGTILARGRGLPGQ